MALERRRAVSEASLSLGLFGQRVVRAAAAEGCCFCSVLRCFYTVFVSFYAVFVLKMSDDD